MNEPMLKVFELTVALRRVLLAGAHLFQRTDAELSNLLVPESGEVGPVFHGDAKLSLFDGDCLELRLFFLWLESEKLLDEMRIRSFSHG